MGAALWLGRAGFSLQWFLWLGRSGFSLQWFLWLGSEGLGSAGGKRCSAWAQQLGCMSLAASRHMGSSRACVLSCFSRVRLFAVLWTIICQAPLSVGFFRQEYWSGLLCPPPGDLPDPGIEPESLKSPALACGFLTTGPPGKPTTYCLYFCLFLTLLSTPPQLIRL